MDLKSAVVDYLKKSKKTLSLVDLFNILFIKKLISRRDRDALELEDLKTICTGLVNEGVLIEKGSEKFAYNSNYERGTTEKVIETEPSVHTALPSLEPNTLYMMWEYAEHKTNKKLEVGDMFDFYAEGKNRNELTKIMDDFIDYFKIEKNEENLAKWEQHFNNALHIQGIMSKWGEI